MDLPLQTGPLLLDFLTDPLQPLPWLPGLPHTTPLPVTFFYAHACGFILHARACGYALFDSRSRACPSMTSGTLPILTADGRSFNMLALIESWEEGGRCPEDNTGQFLVLLLLKGLLDCLFLSWCRCQMHTSFMGVCSLSLFLVDVALSCAVAAVWFLGPARSPVSICFLLAHASEMFNALPVPVLVLGSLDYASELLCKVCRTTSCRALWNCTLVLLVWVLAGVRSCSSAVTELMTVEYEGGKGALGCAVQESVFMLHFSAGLILAMPCVVLLHYKQLYSWLNEAIRLSEQSDSHEPLLQSQSHLCYADLGQLGPKKEKALVVEKKRQRYPFHLRMTLGFGATWVSYLFICIQYKLLGIGIPAYISVSVLWVECANCLLVELRFWLKSGWLGPYRDLPDDHSQWKICCRLRRGDNTNSQKRPKFVFGLSGKDRETILYV
ncbi:hypothetical protein UPYG_G00239200 [Umbra pygmaea]|uniref:G-protein coupled receptors family 1 profile domain-containing protein n=1 Tax=Umbra pygmaea TaxID=75934 RepID=A0ABD0WZ60_UMBPY